jgi:hypothetical protein
MPTRAQKSLAAAAAAHLAKDENSVESRSGSLGEIARQASALAEWARELKVLLGDDYISGLEKFETPSTEHEVFLWVSDRRVVKCTFPGAFGFVKDTLAGRTRKATPLSYLCRLELMNEVFGDCLVMEGVALGTPRSGSSTEKRPYLIISQEFIEAEDEGRPEPSEEEIADFMLSLGFNKVDNFDYQWHREHDRIIVCDAKPANFVKSHEGVIPIDLLISKINPATTDE